ncbi:phage holin family protein [Dechloromonas sp. H13]|uniref:phage holin family protein n=1 Tax=Dechloromonas sp. H13 TaxID=2570193 RepID=UPI001292062D|nr:phage holin family protein [Dechloromonas sp. H13]
MSAGTGGEAGRQGLFVSLKNLVATLLAIGKTRAELLVNELEEEKFRLMSLWAKAIGAAWLFALGTVMVVCCLAVAFWEQRVLVFGLASVLFLGVGFMVFASLRRQMAQPSKIFRGSLAELEADMAQLRRHKDVQ